MARQRPILAKPRRRAARQTQPAKAGRIRIVVADSQAIDRGGLVSLLEDERDFEVVGEAATVQEAVRQCTALKPDVLMLSRLEVAALIVEGQSNKEISTTLGISEPTVKKHIGRILVKPGLPDRLQAGLLLTRNPLIFRR